MPKRDDNGLGTTVLLGLVCVIAQGHQAPEERPDLPVRG